MQEQRYSRQREAILENLKNRYDHPTAMELYLSVREDIPNLSLGTLYRNLTLLRDSGKIISLTLGGRSILTLIQISIIISNAHPAADISIYPLSRLTRPLRHVAWAILRAGQRVTA